MLVFNTDSQFSVIAEIKSLEATLEGRAWDGRESTPTTRYHRGYSSSSTNGNRIWSTTTVTCRTMVAAAAVDPTETCTVAMATATVMAITATVSTLAAMAAIATTRMSMAAAAAAAAAIATDPKPTTTTTTTTTTKARTRSQTMARRTRVAGGGEGTGVTGAPGVGEGRTPTTTTMVDPHTHTVTIATTICTTRGDLIQVSISSYSFVVRISKIILSSVTIQQYNICVVLLFFSGFEFSSYLYLFWAFQSKHTGPQLAVTVILMGFVTKKLL